MKVEYICEICGKRCENEREARACEKSHALQKKREDLRQKSIEAISSLYEAHLKQFGEVPELELSDEGVALAKEYTSKAVADFMNECFDEFWDDICKETNEKTEEKR
jgi:hypothetical protein